MRLSVIVPVYNEEQTIGEIVERIRADPGLHHVPAILVTSRGADEDRQRGREAGAQGYIVKSEFNQVELLLLIRPLVG